MSDLIIFTKSASSEFDSLNVKVLLSMMCFLVVMKLVLGNFLSFILSYGCNWNFNWNYDSNFTSAFNTNLTWNVSDITHILTASATIVYDSSNLQELLSMMSICIDFSVFVNNSSRETTEITNEMYYFRYKLYMQYVSIYTYFTKSASIVLDSSNVKNNKSVF